MFHRFDNWTCTSSILSTNRDYGGLAAGLPYRPHLRHNLICFPSVVLEIEHMKPIRASLEDVEARNYVISLLHLWKYQGMFIQPLSHSLGVE